MTTLASGASATVTLSADQQLQTTGSGTAVYGAGPQRGQPVALFGPSTLGPFEREQVLYLTGQAGGLVYEAVSPPFPPEFPADELTPAQVSATQALVSGAGNILSVLRPEAAGPFVAKVARGTTPTRLTAFGDSVSGFLVSYFASDLATGYLQTGYGFTALAPSLSGSATATTTAFDIWPSGITFSIPSGSYVEFTIGGGQRAVTRAAAWIAKEPGAGAVTVELRNAGGTVVQTLATAASCAGTVGEVYQAAYSGALTVAVRMRVTCTSGTIRCVGAILERTDVFGVTYAPVGQGGIALSSVSTAAWSNYTAVMTWLAPDAYFLGLRDTVDSVEALSARCLISIAALTSAAPNCSVFVCSAWSGVGDPGNSTTSVAALESAAYKAAADAVGAVYLDAYFLLGSYAQILAVDPSYDGTHIGAMHQQLLHSVLSRQIGFANLSSRRMAQDVQSASVTGQTVSVVGSFGDAPSALLRGDVLSSNVDAAMWLQRGVNFFTSDGSLRVGRIKAQAGFSAARFYADAGGATDTSDYSRNGEWTLFLHPTTGVLTAYGLVGGTLKSVALGTLV